jgi:hypothetical protein
MIAYYTGMHIMWDRTRAFLVRNLNYVWRDSLMLIILNLTGILENS